MVAEPWWSESPVVAVSGVLPTRAHLHIKRRRAQLEIHKALHGVGDLGSIMKGGIPRSLELRQVPRTPKSLMEHHQVWGLLGSPVEGTQGDGADHR